MSIILIKKGKEQQKKESIEKMIKGIKKGGRGQIEI